MRHLLNRTVLRWRRRAGSRSGFTLIEILIAVLVLALGLLGLGAVFPVVVRQQRQSTDTVLGITALRSAEAFLVSQGRGVVRPATPAPMAGDIGWLNEPSAVRAPWLISKESDMVKASRGWDVLLTAWKKGATTTTAGGTGGEPPRDRWSTSGKWEPLTITPELSKPDVGTVYVKSEKPYTSSTPLVTVQIPMSQRLFPSPDVSTEQPQYVWDFVARRVESAGGGAQNVQLALFVRRIDPGIRVPRGRTLTDVLLKRLLGTTGPAGNAAARVPVGANYDADPNTQVPTLDGTGKYSQIMRADFVFSSTVANRLTLQVGDDASGKAIRRAVRQIGQKLVDNRGNIYTVVKLEDKASASDIYDTVYIDVQVSQAERDQSRKVGADSKPLFNIAFTPQIPAAVNVVNIPR